MNIYRNRILVFLSLCLALTLAARAETVALALSGGGARGFAIIGVIQALEEEHLAPDLVVGTSMGAVLGGLWAAGYDATDLRNIALGTDWSSLFLDRPARRNLFLAQKETSGRHILLLRFRGFSPELPVALTNGQKLTEHLFGLVHSAPYQAWPTFDDLRIPFRCVATDLNTGKPVVFKSGDLSEAMRASISLPLVFTPYHLDTLLLVDGGVIENVPVDVARGQGADVVVAVDISAGLETDDNLTLPWEVAGRVTTIMQAERNLKSCTAADAVITPNVGLHQSNDFTGIAELIDAGYKAAKAQMPLIKTKMHRADSLAGSSSVFCSRNTYRDFLAKTPADSLPPLRYQFSGVHRVPDSTIAVLPSGRNGLRKLELLRRTSMDAGHVLARANSLELTADRTLNSTWDEGRIRSIRAAGLHRYRPGALLREFPLHEGEIFDLHRAKRGLAQVYGSDLFESVTLSVLPSDSGANLILRAVERQSPQLRLGAGYSSDRGGRSFVEFLNDNVLDLGARMVIFGRYGEQAEEARGEITFDRLPFNTSMDEALQSYLTTDFRGGWRREEHRYYDAAHHRKGFFHFERSGAELWFGRAFRRWGEMSFGARYENVHSGGVPEEVSSSTTFLGIRTIIDTKDRYPFPNNGIGLNGCYEFAVHSRENGRLFNRFKGIADAYIEMAPRVVLHGRADYAWNDRQLPLWAQFSMGGEESLLGLHSAEMFGNCKLAFLGEFRYDLISRWIADAYLSALYTAGAVTPETDPLPAQEDYQHGVGASFALSTLLGPMKLTVGHVFKSGSISEHTLIYLNLGHDF
jgi:NTE family protein